METYWLLIIIAVAFGHLIKASTECNEKQEGCKRAIRKRREAPQRTCLDGAKSPQQATDELKAYEGQLAVDSYNDASMLKKSQFLTAVKTFIPNVCRNLTVGSAPVRAASTLAGLVVQRQACDKNDSTLSDVPCEGCSEIAKYRIKENLLVKNSQWNCSQNNLSCDGVCIGSLRMPKDLMSNYSTGCRSHVIHVQMFSPKTAHPVAVNNPGEVMLVEIQFNEDRSKIDNSDYKCFMWQPGAGRWDDSVCNLTILPILGRRSNQPFVAQCDCTRLGSVCVGFSTTDMNNPASASSGGSSSGGRTTASSGSEGVTTASSGGSGGNGQATTASSGGSGGSGPVTTTSSGGSGGNGQATTASSGGSGGSGTVTTTSSGGSGGNGQGTTASSGGSGGSRPATTTSPGGSTSGGAQLTTASSGSGQATTTSPGGSAGSADTSGTLFASLKLAGDCNSIVGTANEQPFRTAAKTKLIETFHWRREQIYNLDVKCGSIVLSFSISQLDPTTVKYHITNIGQVAISNFTISLPDGRSFTVFQANVGYASDNVTIFAPPAPTLPPTTGKRYELVFDYTPIMATVALGIALVLLCVCCTCIVHSWYLRKEKYTEYNSMTIKEYEEKMRAKNKNEFPMTEMEQKQEAVARPRTTNFDMTNEEMPQINERSLANYDWARTSYLPGMLAQPSGVHNEDAPRLILDEDSDSDSEKGEGEGEDNEGFEKSTLDIAKSTSHLSLDNLNPSESNDSSQKNLEAPPLYDNVADAAGDRRDHEQQDIYENVNFDIPDGNSGVESLPPRPTEPEYFTIQ